MRLFPCGRVPHALLSLCLATLVPAATAPAATAAHVAPARPAAAPALAAAQTVGGPRLGARGLIVDLPPETPAPPAVSAAAYVVADAGSGRVLAAKAPHVPLPPASTLKTLTALTVIGALRRDQLYTARHDDAAVIGARVGIVPDATYTVDQLFQALFLRSGNDAANALANAAGGVPKTVASMQATARQLHAMDTLVVNPSGLDAPRQVSSAYDLALLGRATIRSPDLLRYAGTVQAQFPGEMPRQGQRRSTYALFTTQKLLLDYDGALGIKNGYTTKARNTLIAAARRGDRTLIVTLMRSERKTWKEAAALMDWGFAHAARARPVGTLVEPGSGPRSPAAPGGSARWLDDTAGVHGGSASHFGSFGGSLGVLASLLGWVLSLLAVLIAGLRARVLLRRRFRRRFRRGPLRPFERRFQRRAVSPLPGVDAPPAATESRALERTRGSR